MGRLTVSLSTGQLPVTFMDHTQISVFVGNEEDSLYRSPKSQCLQQEMKQAASMEMQKGQEGDSRESEENTSVQLSCTQRKGAESCSGEKAGAEQALISPQEGKWGRALTMDLTLVSGLLQG